jgi:hypothetical protein
MLSGIVTQRDVIVDLWNHDFRMSLKNPLFPLPVWRAQDKVNCYFVSLDTIKLDSAFVTQKNANLIKNRGIGLGLYSDYKN